MRFKFDGLEFGTGTKLGTTAFNPGTTQLRLGDTERSQRDGVIPGRDYMGSKTWGISITTDATDLDSARELEAALASRWHDPKHRTTPGALVPLAYQLGDRWRRVYGRPDRFSGSNGDVRALQGGARLECDFRVLDARYFDDVESKTTLTFIPASSGGLISPFVAPFATRQSSGQRAGLVTNTGQAATPLKVVFRGPIKDPWVRSPDGWEIALLGTLAYDVSVTIDAMASTVRRSDGAAVFGMLTRKSRLSLASLPPGASELTFGGIDPTGSSRAELSWRNAYYSI